MKLVVFWGQGVTASHPGFVTDAQMVSLLLGARSSQPLRNILRYVIGYPELLTAVHHQP